MVRSLDGMTVATALFRFDDSYAREVPGLSVPWAAAPVPAPELLVLNEELARELGADPAALREPPGVLLLVGQVPAGVATVAQAYAGPPRATCGWARSSTPPRPATPAGCARWPTTPSPGTIRRPPAPLTATSTSCGAWPGRRRPWWPGGCWPGSCTGS